MSSTTTSSQKDLTYDRLFWILAIALLVMLAHAMLVRDSQKQYGAVAFGSFPAFTTIDTQGEPFDQHHLHGQLSAIIITQQTLPEDIALYLHKLSQVTAMGKKYLRTLVLINQPTEGHSDPTIQYLKINQDDFRALQKWSTTFKDGIFLVDQNGVVRGVFNIVDKLERISFESAVKAIL